MASRSLFLPLFIITTSALKIKEKLRFFLESFFSSVSNKARRLNTAGFRRHIPQHCAVAMLIPASSSVAERVTNGRTAGIYKRVM